MCLEGCMSQVRERLERDHATKTTETTQESLQESLMGSSLEQGARRHFLKKAFAGSLAGFGVAAATLGATLGSTLGNEAFAMDHDETKEVPHKKRLLRRGIRKVVDLTHTFSPTFPTFGGFPGISAKKVADYDKDKFNVHKYEIFEHAGTHLDAPLHVTKHGASSADIHAEQLVVPLIKVDIRAKAEQNPDAQLTIDDLKAWEKKHGRIPRRSCVAMDSGWERHVSGKKFRNADDKGGMHFPGFHAETADFLINRRGAMGIAVDTLSLDHGPSPDFAMHYEWLPQGKWGIECVANLRRVPAKGAVLVVGVQKIEGGTGGLTRVIALM